MELKPGGSRLDRYGHLLAQVFVVTGGTRLWLQEGTVATVGEGGGRIYLNFAKDWRSDFTISVDRKDVPAFAAAGIDLKAARRETPARSRLPWLAQWADDRSEPSGADRALAGGSQARHTAAASNGAGYRAIGQAVP